MQINTANVVLKLENETQCLDCKSRCSDGFLGFLFNKNKSGEIVVLKQKSHSGIGHLTDNGGFFNGTQKANEIIGMKFEEEQLLKLSLVLYGLPILILVFGLIIGYVSFNWFNLNPDLGGVFGFVFGLFLSKHMIKFNYFRLSPQVVFFK